jgi:drug/metabolite transporter (DMT)-like permease
VPRTVQIENRKSEIENEPSHRRGAAVAAMFLSGVLFAVMGLTTKATALPFAGRPLPAAQVALIRFAFGALMLLPLHGRGGIDLLGKNRRGLLGRGIYGGVAVCFYFLALQQTSLSHALLLNYTSLVFAPLFAAAFLRERITPRTCLAIAIALVGTLLVLVKGPETGRLNMGDLYGLLSGLLAGAAITEIRRLRQTETAWSVFFYLSIVGVPIALALMVGLNETLVWPTATGWLLLAAMATSSMVAQILMTLGFKYVRAAEGTLILMSQLVYTTAASVWLFGEQLGPMTAIGGALILGAAVWLSLQKADRGRKTVDDGP